MAGVTEKKDNACDLIISLAKWTLSKKSQYVIHISSADALKFENVHISKKDAEKLSEAFGIKIHLR